MQIVKQIDDDTPCTPLNQLPCLEQELAETMLAVLLLDGWRFAGDFDFIFGGS